MGNASAFPQLRSFFTCRTFPQREDGGTVGRTEQDKLPKLSISLEIQDEITTPLHIPLHALNIMLRNNIDCLKPNTA